MNPTPQVFDDLDTGSPPLLYIWYRQSPRPLVNASSPDPDTVWPMPGQVGPSTPPLQVPGEVCVFLDARGRLLELHVVPRPETSAASRGDWTTLLKAAGFDEKALTECAPSQLPRVYADERKAWTGHFPARAHMAARIEAAAFQGRPVFFLVTVPPDDRAGVPLLGEDRLVACRPLVATDPGLTVLSISAYLITALLLFVGGFLTWFNIHRGRANLRGALWLGSLLAGVLLLLWFWGARHSLNLRTEFWSSLVPTAGWAVAVAGTTVLAYLALEPAVRWRWPWRVVGWNRLLEGRWRDPLVGREILLGAAAGMLLANLGWLMGLTPLLFGEAPLLHTLPPGGYETGALAPLSIFSALSAAFLGFFLLFLPALLIRKELVAIAGSATLLTVLNAATDNAPLYCLPWQAAQMALIVVVLLRLGLLPYLVMYCCYVLALSGPRSLDPSVWYASGTVASGVGLLALVVFAYLTATAGQRLLRFGEEPAKMA